LALWQEPEFHREQTDIENNGRKPMNNVNERHCIVMLPPGPNFERLFNEVLELAVIETGLVPCRIQQNPDYPTPINIFIDEIEQAGAILADISENTSEIWMAVGCAVSLGKPLCLISSRPEARQPSGMQYLPLIPYPATAFPSDYIQLQQNVTAQLSAIMPRITITIPQAPARVETITPAAHVPPPSDELVSYEIEALTIINQRASETGLSPRELGFEMKARDSAHLTRHAMNALKRRGFIERKPVQVSDGFEQHTSENLFLTRSGADWLIRYTRRAAPAHRSSRFRGVYS
jgi:hypothetical protein